MTKEVLKLISQNKFIEAENLLRNSKRFSGNAPEKLWLLSRVFTEQQKHEKAINALQEIRKHRSLSASEKNTLAINFRLAGYPNKALMLFQEIEKSGLKDFSIYHNIANCFFDTGKTQNAIEYYQKAIQLNPNYVPSHENLNLLLWEQRETDSLFNSYKQQLKVNTSNTELLISFVRLLKRSGNTDTAIKTLNDYALRQTENANIIALRAELQKDLGQIASARSSFETNFQKVQFSKQQITSYIEILILSGDLNLAHQFLTGMLKVHSDDQTLLALLSYVQPLIHNNSLSALTNYKQLVRVYDIGNYLKTDKTLYLGHLKDELNSLHQETRAPLLQTLRGGSQTKGNLFTADEQGFALDTLKAFCLSSVSKYCKEISAIDSPYPGFKENHNGDFKFNGSWSVKLNSGGHHYSHMHPMGWLSSVFYVDIPDSICTTNAKQGWLNFGLPNFISESEHFIRLNTQPKPGLLVLFPSYFWHGTYPFEDEKSRLTVAFDVIKAKTHKNQ